MDNNAGLEQAWLDLKRNCDYYFSRIISYPIGTPEHAYFSVTNQCNLRCRMCNVPAPANHDDSLTCEEVKETIDQIAELKINHLIFSGGEPLLRPDILDLISYASGKGIKMVDVISNGILLNDELAQGLIKSGMTHITISIDGLEEKEDFIRGDGSFKKAVRALDIMNKYKCKNSLPSLGINFTIMDCNFDQIPLMIDLARSKKCNIIVLQPMLSDNTDMQKRKKSELWVSRENMPRLKKIIKKVTKLKQSMQDLCIHVNDKILEMIPDYFSEWPQGSMLKCYECIVRIVISNNGDLWTCQGNYGNLKKGMLRSQWFSFKAKKIRKAIKECKNHCLQSCVHLAELSDVYPEMYKFKNLINNSKDNKIYARKLYSLLANYKFLLKKKLIKYSKNKSINGEGILEELECELSNISDIIKG